MRAAFFVDTARLNREWSFDVHDQSLSGTDSMMVGVAHYVCVVKEQGLIYVTSLPQASSRAIRLVENLASAVQAAENEGLDIIIFNAISNMEQKKLLSQRSKNSLQLLLWAQNTPDLEYLNLASRNSRVRYLICVSNVAAFMLSYHPVFNKVIVMHNYVDCKYWTPISKNTKQPIVLYVGALKPAKGFHWLAKEWPLIHAEHPNWLLKVCGAPSLYGEHDAIGIYGIAEKAYEQEILLPLGGSPANASNKGVQFLGMLNKDDLKKNMCEASFVIVNPNIKSSIETFCVSAVEAQSMELAIVGAAAGGLLETVGQGVGGLLCNNATELQKNILNLISDPILREKLGERGRKQALGCFDQPIVLQKWEQLLLQEQAEALKPQGKDFMPRDFLLRSLIRYFLPLSAISYLKRIRSLVKR